MINLRRFESSASTTAEAVNVFFIDFISPAAVKPREFLFRQTKKQYIMRLIKRIFGYAPVKEEFKESAIGAMC